jgi:hypothetical protein
MKDVAGLAVPSQTTLMILSRSIACAKASRSFRLSSSRLFFFFGFALKMKSFVVTPGTWATITPAFFSVAIAVGGTDSIASISPDFIAEMSASSFENIRSPKLSMWGFGP